METNLPAYKVIYENGQSYVTLMADGVTLEDARAYFIDRFFEQPDGRSLRVTEVRHAAPSGFISDEAWSQ